MTVVPASLVLVQETVPPWASASDFTMARPSPVPPRSRVRAGSAGYPEQVAVLFTPCLDDVLERGAREIGVTACLSKTQAPQLPTILRDLPDR